jgi:hypothetical protein
MHARDDDAQNLRVEERRRRALLTAGASLGAPSLRAVAGVVGLSRETLLYATRGRPMRVSTAAKLEGLLGAELFRSLFGEVMR